MATFPDYQPLYTPVKVSQPLVRVTRFGDGYEQRLSYGLNQNPKAWQMVFEMSDEEANVVEAFLDARADDGTSFDWQAPDQDAAQKWVCDSWDRQLWNYDRSKISVTFRQVFEP